jgi:hypothetical protein
MALTRIAHSCNYGKTHCNLIPSALLLVFRVAYESLPCLAAVAPFFVAASLHPVILMSVDAGGTGKAEAPKPPGAGIVPKRCPRRKGEKERNYGDADKPSPRQAPFWQVRADAIRKLDQAGNQPSAQPPPPRPQAKRGPALTGGPLPNLFLHSSNSGSFGGRTFQFRRV